MEAIHIESDTGCLPFRLLNLVTEIRLQIFQNYFTDLNINACTPWYNKRLRKGPKITKIITWKGQSNQYEYPASPTREVAVSLSILLSCKQIYNECYPIFLRRTRFHYLNYHPSASRPYDKVGIRRVVGYWYSGYKTQGWNLRVWVLSIRKSDLTNRKIWENYDEVSMVLRAPIRDTGLPQTDREIIYQALNALRTRRAFLHLFIGEMTIPRIILELEFKSQKLGKIICKARLVNRVVTLTYLEDDSTVAPAKIWRDEIASAFIASTLDESMSIDIKDMHSTQIGEKAIGYLLTDDIVQDHYEGLEMMFKEGG